MEMNCDGIAIGIQLPEPTPPKLIQSWSLYPSTRTQNRRSANVATAGAPKIKRVAVFQWQFHLFWVYTNLTTDLTVNWWCRFYMFRGFESFLIYQISEHARRLKVWDDGWQAGLINGSEAEKKMVKQIWGLLRRVQVIQGSLNYPCKCMVIWVICP